MKLMIASDIHGSALYCRAMLDAFERENASALYCWAIYSTMGRATTCPTAMRPSR